MKIIIFMVILITFVFAGERIIIPIENKIIDIDYDLTKNNRTFHIEQACKMAFKNTKDIKKINNCIKIISLDMKTRSGLSRQYLSTNTKVIFQVAYRAKDYHLLNFISWISTYPDLKKKKQ